MFSLFILFIIWRYFSFTIVKLHKVKFYYHKHYFNILLQHKTNLPHNNVFLDIPQNYGTTLLNNNGRIRNKILKITKKRFMHFSMTYKRYNSI